jgi:hypothetical protein
MNTSFDRLHLVNTYGAFGSVGQERFEIVFEGTADEVIGADTQWREIEFRCKPGDPARRPCFVSPGHLRLDWLIWFAAMEAPVENPWAVHLVAKLLEGEPAVIHLLADDYPFRGRPPRWIRARWYRYWFTAPGEPGWWQRNLADDWLPPLSRDDAQLRGFLASFGWESPVASDESPR